VQSASVMILFSAAAGDVFVCAPLQGLELMR